jgi:hypothetical protein
LVLNARGVSAAGNDHRQNREIARTKHHVIMR